MSPEPRPVGGIPLLALVIAGGAVLVGLASVAVAVRGRPPRPELIDSRARTSEADAPGVAESWPADSRLAALAAYRRARGLLSAAGVPADAGEGPREYLARVAAERGSGQKALRELTLAYETARFSHHAFGQQQRVAALRAFGELERDLEATG